MVCWSARPDAPAPYLLPPQPKIDNPQFYPDGLTEQVTGTGTHGG